ncbi:uncharacterized protein [Amphiura filiformis]|uniref:uncharacterized protein n=1 Tax=Amphiura filiformis TaxID=82378 RepID=UPI003B20F357
MVKVGGAVSGLPLGQVTSNSIQVLWHPRSFAVSYLVYYSPELGTSQSPESTTQTQHTVTGLPQGRFFCIHVTTTVSGDTNQIGRICAYTLPVQPGNINELCTTEPEKCSDDCVTVEWDSPVGGNYHGYHIEWKRTIDANPCPTCWDTVGRYTMMREYKICNLEPNTAYEVSVFTYIGHGLHNAFSAPEVGGGSTVTATTDPAPTAPYLVLDEYSDVIICFSWSVATTNDNSVPTYAIEIKEAITDQNVQTIMGAHFNQYCVGNLDSASLYEVTVQPSSASGVTYTPITVATKPSVPFTLHVSVFSTAKKRRKRASTANPDITITISWTPPEQIDFDFYVVSWQPSTQAPVMLPNDATSYTLTGLQPDTLYTISMYTTKHLNNGQVVQSETIHVTSRTQPLGELVLYTDTTSTDLYVEWGGVTSQTLSGYHLVLICPLPPATSTVTESQTVGFTDLLVFEFTNLEPGSECRLSIDAVGTVLTSTCDIVIEPLPPQEVTCTDVTRSSFIIEWTEPASGLYDGYIIEYTPPEGQPMIIPPQSAAATRRVEVASLNPGMEYIVCVATYSVRTTERSECAFKSVTTVALTPNTPQIVVRRCETTSLQFTWGDASDVAGFIGYIVSIAPDHGMLSGSITSRQLTYEELQPGTTYVICVQVDATTDLVEKETTQTRPLPPTNVQVASTSAVSLTTTWSLSTQASCDSYKITVNNDDTGAPFAIEVVGNNIGTYLTTGLVPSTFYDVCVTCSTGPKSSDPACVLQQTSAVPVGDIIVLSISVTSFEIVWGRANIDSDYIVQLFQGNQGSEIQIAIDYGSESYTFTGLVAATVYRVLILQQSNAGVEYASEYVRTYPSPVSSVSVTNIMPTTATVSWVDDEICDFYVINIICLCPNQEPVSTHRGNVYPGENLEFQDTELIPGCPYQYVIFKVLSQTSQFTQQSSSTISDEFQAALVPANTVLGRVCTKTTLIIVWSEVAGANSYSIYVGDNPPISVAADPGRDTVEIEIDSLDPGTLYAIRVQLIGLTGNVDEIELRTIPNEILNLQSSGVTASSINLSWNNPIQGLHDGFIVNYSPPDGQTQNGEIVPQGATSFSFIGLSPAVTYDLCVSTFSGPDDATRKISDPVCHEETTDIDDCAASPCLNGGTCTDGINDYMCACVMGYEGANCETNIDDCAASPCMNGGACTDEINGYTCACVTGYEGDNCETRPPLDDSLKMYVGDKDGLDPPMPVGVEVGPTYEVTVGDSLIFTCYSQDAFPDVDITWDLDGTVLTGAETDSLIATDNLWDTINTLDPPFMAAQGECGNILTCTSNHAETGTTQTASTELRVVVPPTAGTVSLELNPSLNPDQDGDDTDAAAILIEGLPYRFDCEVTDVDPDVDVVWNVKNEAGTTINTETDDNTPNALLDCTTNTYTETYDLLAERVTHAGLQCGSICCVAGGITKTITFQIWKPPTVPGGNEGGGNGIQLSYRLDSLPTNTPWTDIDHNENINLDVNTDYEFRCIIYDISPDGSNAGVCPATSNVALDILDIDFYINTNSVSPGILDDGDANANEPATANANGVTFDLTDTLTHTVLGTHDCPTYITCRVAVNSTLVGLGVPADLPFTAARIALKTTPGQFLTQVLTSDEICIVFGPISGVTDYVISITPPDSVNNLAMFDANTGYCHCFPGLQPATVYTIVVTSQNAGQGTGQQTFDIQVRTDPSCPGAITIEACQTDSFTQICVSWEDAPDTNAGDPAFDYYIVYYTDSDGNTVEAGRVFYGEEPYQVIDGLFPDEQYVIEVVTVLDPLSPFPEQRCEGDAEVGQTETPDPGEIVCLDVTLTSFYFTWGDASSSYSDFLNYFVQVTDSKGTIQSGTVNMNDRLATFSSLTPGEEYCITVQILLEFSTDVTNVFCKQTKTLDPGEIICLDVTTTSFLFTWGDASSSYNDFLNYIVQVRDSQGIIQSGAVNMNDRLATFSGLTPGEEYCITVSILLEFSTNATRVFCKQTRTPDPGEIVCLDVTTTSFQFTWGDASSSYNDFLNYFVQVRDSQGIIRSGTVNLNERLATFNSLTPGEEYCITVRILLQSSNDVTRVDCKRTRPNAPSNLQCSSILSTSLRFTWSAPSGSFDNYLITYAPSNGSPASPISVQPSDPRDIELTNLLPNTNYTISIVTVVGQGAASVLSDPLERSCQTSVAQPADIIIQDITETCVTFTWGEINLAFDNYVLYVFDEEQNGNIDTQVSTNVDDITSCVLTPGKLYTIILETNPIVSVSGRKSFIAKPNPAQNIQCAGSTVTSVTVTWQAPASSGGLPAVFDVYKIYIRQGTGPRNLVATIPNDGSALAYPIVGLLSSSDYTVSIETCSTENDPNGAGQITSTSSSPPPSAMCSTVSIDPLEILVQEVGTRSILAVFGASSGNADPNGKYRYYIDTAEDTFVARGETLDVADADIFFDYQFDNLIPGTVFTITLSVELVDGQDDISMIQVLTCPEPPAILEQTNNDAVTAAFSWPLPFGQYTNFEVTFERPGQDPEMETTEDPEINFEHLFPDTEYTVTVRTVRVWEKEGVTKKSDPVSLTIETIDLSALQIVIQDFGTDFINIVFGEGIQDAVYEIFIDPGNCPCGWREFGDSCYYIAHTSRLTYADAQDYCENKDGNLVSIISQAEQDFLAGCTENDPDTSDFGFWLGLNDIANEGTFVFEDGSTFDVGYIGNWATGQPDNGGTGGNEDCAIMWQIPSQENNWGDVSCSQEQAFICKKQKANPGVNYPVQPSATAAHAFTQLVPGQCYTITVDADEYAAQSEQQRTDPDLVSGITLEEVSPAYARLSWTLPNGIHDGFYVSYGVKDSGEYPTDYPYRLLKGVKGVQLWDLEPGTEYVVIVYTVASYGDCDELTSLAQEFEFSTIDKQPGTVYLKDKDTDSITVTWGEATSTQTLDGYQLFLCPDSCDDPIVFGPDITKYTFDGLVPGREYSMRFQVLRTGGNNDAMQLIVTRTSPLSVQNFEAESFPNLIMFTWEAPPGGDYDQYVLWYSTCNCLQPGENDLQYEVIDSYALTYYLWVDVPNTIVFASLSTRSQVECPSEPSDSIPAFIYGTETADLNLAPLEIFIIRKGTNSILLSWGQVAGENVLYTLSWYPESDDSNLKERITKNTRWLIQGLAASTSYYINVEYANLQSPNDGLFTTTISPPTGLPANPDYITPTSALLEWNVDGTGLTDSYLVYYEPWNELQYKCAAHIVYFEDGLFTEETEAKLTYLVPGVQYRARVFGQNKVPAVETFVTDSIPYGECQTVGVYSTCIVAVWDSVIAPTDVYGYRRTVRVDATDEVHGVQDFTPSDHPYVTFGNLWPGTQYEVCCEVLQINIPVPAENCIPQVTAPQGPFIVFIQDEDLQGFCVYWDGPLTNFDNYVIKIINEDGITVYPPVGVATLPAGDPQYEALPPEHTYQCIDSLLPGNTYTVTVGTWVDGIPEPQFSDRFEIEATTEILNPLKILIETQEKNELTIQWGSIDEAGVENPQYTVEWYEKGYTGLPDTFGTTDTRYTITGLEAGKGHNIRVLYLDEESENSGFFYTIPCPPENLVAINNANFPRSGTQFSLSWDPPTDGVYEGFRISVTDPDSSTNEKLEVVVVAADTLSYTVVGLNVNQVYIFCVETIVGFDVLPNDTSSEAVSIEGSTDDLGPLVIEISGRDMDHFLVSWGPIDNPSEQETQYVITAKTEAGAIAASDLVSIGEPTNSLLFPLNSGIKYNIQVKIGDRESDVVCMYTILNPPGVIFLNRATSSTLDIGWGPAENSVGEYEITYSNGGTFGPFSRSPQDRQLELEGLSPGTKYEFSVVNTVGEGVLKTDSEPSTASFTTRSAILTILATNSPMDTVNVQWTEEVGDFDTYLLRVIDTDQGSTQEIVHTIAPNIGNGDVLAINNLIPGTLYHLELYTKNDEVEELSDIEEVITGPAPPQNLQLTSNTFSTLNLQWDAPLQGGWDGFEVSYDYVIPFNSPIGLTPSPTNILETAIALEGLLPSKEFMVQVRTFRQLGVEIRYSGYIEMNFSTLEADEGKLIIRNVTETTIDLLWTPISGAERYNIQLCNINNNDVIVYSESFTGNTALLEDLVSGAVYKVQFIAINIDGGDTQVQATIPPPVDGLTRIQRSIDSITLGWNGLDGGSEGEATGFIVRYSPRPDGALPYQEIPNPSGENTEVTITLNNLLIDQQYDFTIVTYTEFTGIDDGVVHRELSDKFEYSVTTHDLNPAQVQITDVYKDYVCFKWGGTNSDVATHFELSITDVDNAVPQVQRFDIDVATLEYCFRNLQPGTLYDLEVNVLGAQELGTERFRTNACRPQNLREVVSFQCSITIAWDPADGQADVYRVYYRKTDPPGQDPVLAVNVYPGQALTYTLKSLDAETGYEFRVETVAGGELQEVSDAAVTVVYTDIETLLVTQLGNTLNVSWPSIDADFLLYELHHSPENGDRPSSIFVPSTAQRIVQLTGLTSGQQYNLVLNIVSADGERGLITKTCYTLQPPAIPIDMLTVTPLTDQAQTVVIAFDIPSDMLSNAIVEAVHILATPATAGAGTGNPVELEYIVPFEACPEILLTGLCPDTFYVITIYTLSGTSLSEPVTTSLTTPPAPAGQISFGEYTATSIEVYWADAEDVDYTVTISYETSSGTSQVKEQVTVPSSDARTYTFMNLTPGTLYTVTVSASSSSSYLDKKSLRTRPISFFGFLRASHIGHDSIILSWPSATGVDGYEVCYYNAKDQESKSYDVHVSFTDSTIESLLPETAYIFSVASFIGEGAERSTSQKLALVVETDTDPMVPPPRNVLVSSFGPHNATLQWDAPSRDDYDYFLVEYRPDDTGVPDSPILLSHNQFVVTISNLIPYTDYVFMVHSLRGKAGLDETLSVAVSVTETTAPFPFIMQTLEVTDTTIQITWGPHESPALARYEVSYVPDEGFITDPVVEADEIRLARLHSLRLDAPYRITVSAVGAVGEVLNVAIATVNTLKLQVQSFKAIQETTNSVFLYWPPAVDQLPNGQQQIIEDVKGYYLYVRSYSDYRGAGDVIAIEFSPQSACPSITLRGLYPGRKYHISLVAVDDDDNAITSPASIVVETLPRGYLDDLHVVYVDTNTIEVTWNPPLGFFSNYLLQYSPAGLTPTFRIFDNAQERRWELEGLTPGQLYTIQLTVQSIDNTELYTSTLRQFTIPASPTDLVFSRTTDTGFDVAWPAVFQGRSEFFGFCIHPDPQAINVEFVYNALNYEVGGLYPTTTYLVSVFNEVEDELGNRVWSPPITEYQETSVGEPGVPIVVNFDEMSVRVSWVQVEGATRYYVRRNQVDGTDAASESVNAGLGLTVEYRFTGLQPGEEYFFYVNPDSAEYQEEYVKQRTKPLSPLFVRMEYDADNPSERIITWQPPVAGRVDRYEIVYSPPIGTPPPPIYIPGTSVFLRQVITGLNPAQTYQFFVRAEAGIGPDEIRTRSDPAVNIPDQETRILAVENYGHYAIDVVWWPDLPGDFESYVISYEPYDEHKPNVRPSPVEIGREYGITSLNIYGLVPGEEYTIYLQTKTRLQVSPIIQHVTQTTIPLPIDEIHVDLVTASSFVFSWDDAAGIKDQYQVFFEPIADENNPTPALGSLPAETFHPAMGGFISVEVTDLEAAQEYHISVVTRSNNEFSYKTSVIATTRPFPPNFVEILDTTTNSALIQWYDGEVGNLGISRYQIEIVPRDSTRLAVIDANSERNTYRITGLTAGRPYQALIQSIVVDLNGNDLESLPVSVAFVTIPLPPIGEGQPAINSTSITIRWQSGGGDLTSYSLEYSPVPENPSVQSPIIVYPRTNLELTISGLSASTVYTFELKAISKVTIQDSQTGSFDVIKESQTYTVFYTTLPNPVRNLRVTSTTSTSVGLAWEAPEGPVDQYHLFVSHVGRPQPSRPISINTNVPLVYDVTDLNPYTDYNFQIVNVVDGVQSAAATVTVLTGEDVPGAPGGLLVTQLSPNSIHVEWEPTESPNGELQGYVLVVSKRDLSSPGNIVSEEIELPLNQLWYQFDDLAVGYEYTFTVVVVNNVGTGAPYHLGLFVQLRETAPPHTGQAPYRTPDTERKGAYSLSITLREDFFLPIFGRVANYSIMVAEEPNPRKDEISLSQVGEPPQTYHVSSSQHVWPGYQASPPGYNPFVRDIAKRQVGGNQGQDSQAEFIIGTEEDCPDDQLYYCNGWLKSYTYYRVAIRAYGLDGNYTDTPWSEPLSTGFDVLWFVYALVAVIGFVVLCFFIFLCVCCGGCGRPGENDFFEDSKKDKHMLKIKNISSRTSPMESKHKKNFTNYYQAPLHRAPWRRAPTERSYQTPAPKHHSPSSRAEPHKPTAKSHVYASPASQWSKPIYVDQFGEHMRMMNARGGIRYTEELNKLNDIGANLPCNAASNAPEKNRYRNILPYDTNRVCLHDPPDGLDYINASYVDGHHGKNEYIVTQGPLPNTIEDFWEMVWENEIPTIIMNTNLVENGRVKCEKYWPDSGEAQYGRMTVKLISESDTQEWTVRTFEISEDGESKGHVRIFQYRNWPDHGAPQDPRSVLKFVQTVRSQHPRRSGPGIVVHCSAGVGRSGTFVAIDILLQQLAAGHSETLDVFGVCAKLRRQRRYMVQSEEQYKFVHRAVQVYMQQQANYEVMMDGGSNWAMGSSASGAGPMAYSNAGTSIDGYL